MPLDWLDKPIRKKRQDIPPAPEGLKAFMTGSRVYGMPRPESDYDMVVLVTLDEKRKLFERSDDKINVRFSLLNLIPCDIETEKWKFDTWYEGTRRLTEIAPVTRQFAIDTFEDMGLHRSETLGAYPLNKEITFPTKPEKVVLHATTEPLTKWYIDDKAVFQKYMDAKYPQSQVVGTHKTYILNDDFIAEQNASWPVKIKAEEEEIEF